MKTNMKLVPIKFIEELSKVKENDWLYDTTIISRKKNGFDDANGYVSVPRGFCQVKINDYGSRNYTHKYSHEVLYLMTLDGPGWFEFEPNIYYRVIVEDAEESTCENIRNSEDDGISKDDVCEDSNIKHIPKECEKCVHKKVCSNINDYYSYVDYVEKSVTRLAKNSKARVEVNIKCDDFIEDGIYVIKMTADGDTHECGYVSDGRLKENKNGRKD